MAILKYYVIELQEETMKTWSKEVRKDVLNYYSKKINDVLNSDVTKPTPNR